MPPHTGSAPEASHAPLLVEPRLGAGGVAPEEQTGAVTSRESAPLQRDHKVTEPEEQPGEAAALPTRGDIAAYGEAERASTHEQQGRSSRGEVGQAPPAQAQQAGGAGAPLSAPALAAAPPSAQKQMIGEKLFPMIAKQQPELAGKITGMMLEMDNSELLILLESDQQLKVKVDEAMRVLSSGAK